MTTLFEFSKHIAKLKKEKKYSEALAYFKENKSGFTNEQISKNEYISSDILSCLRNTHQFDAGFQFQNIYNIAIDSDQKERILNAYGWLLWSKYKAEHQDGQENDDESHFFDEEEEDLVEDDFHYDKDELIERIEALLIILLQKKSAFSKSLVSNLFTVILKTEKKKPAPNWKLVNDFCSQIDPAALSKECRTFPVERKGKTKEMELASDYESWYAYKSKALMKTGQWQECLDISKEALDKIDQFHYSNDIWFSRRIALSSKYLGNPEKAIDELKIILKKKREWFIEKELAELYFEKGEFDTAFKTAINAVNNFGPLEFKVDLICLIGEILNKQKKLELAFQHFTLAKLIRENEEWKIPATLNDQLKKFTNFKNLNLPFPELKDRLVKFWKGSKQEQANRNEINISAERAKKGEIIKILNDNERGKDGFIKSDGREHYFAASSNFRLTAEIKVGSKVMFKILPANNGRKERTRIMKILR